MAIHIDSDGNFYFGASGTTDFDNISYTPVFSVTKNGVLTAQSGTVGGISLAADHIKSTNYSATSGSEDGFKITDGGDAFFNSVDIRVKPSGNGNEDPPSDGKQSITIGSAEIYEYNNNLYLNSNSSANKIIISAGDKFVLSGSSANPNLTFDGASTQDIEFNAAYVADSSTSDGRSYSSGYLGQIYELTISNQNVDIYRVNAQNNDVYFYGDVEINGTAEFNSFKAYNGLGSSGQVLQRTTNGLEWVNSSGSHSDSDHTSFAASSHDHNSTYYTETEVNNLLANKDNYNYWRLREDGNNVGTVSSTESVNFIGGSGVTVSNSGSGGDYNITISASGTAHTHTSVLSFSANEINIYGSVKPSSNNNRSIGTSSSLRFADMYSTEFHGGTFYGTLVNSSSQNTKTNIENTGLGLDFIEALPVKQFNYITADHSEKKYTGVIAEDVQVILDNNGWDDYYLVVDDSDSYRYKNRCQHPAICTNEELENFQEGNYTCQETCCEDYFKFTEEDGTVSNWIHDTVEECEAYEVDGNRHPHFNYYQLIGPLVKAVQELSTQISDLTARVEELEG